MASKSLQSPAPPIVTADGKVMSVGMQVYRVHTRCCKKNLPTLECLKIIQLDLSSRRRVRLRTLKGIETEWTSNEPLFQKSCDTEPKELLYAGKQAAVKVAKAAAAKITKELHGQIDIERQELATRTHNMRNDVKKAVVAHRNYKLRVAKIGK